MLYTVFSREYFESMGLMTLGFGVFYILVWLWLGTEENEKTHFRYLTGALALGFFTLFVPVQYDQFTVTLLWALEAVIFAFVGTKIASPVATSFSTVLFYVVGYRLVTIDYMVRSYDKLQNDQVYFNPPFLTFLGVVFCAVLACFSYWHHRERFVKTGFKQNSFSLRRHIISLSFLVSMLLVAVPHLELVSFGMDTSWMPIWYLMVVLGVMLSGIYFGSMYLRVVGYCLFVWSFFGVILYPFNMNGAFFDSDTWFGIFAALIIALISYVFYLAPKEHRAFNSEEIIYPISTEEQSRVSMIGFTIANFLLLQTITREIQRYFYDSNYYNKSNIERVVISIVWMLYALKLLVLSIVYKWISARWLSVVLFSIVVVKVFLFDTASLSDIYRFVAYGVLGVMFLAVGYLYQRYKDRVNDFIVGKELQNK